MTSTQALLSQVAMRQAQERLAAEHAAVTEREYVRLHADALRQSSSGHDPTAAAARGTGVTSSGDLVAPEVADAQSSSLGQHATLIILRVTLASTGEPLMFFPASTTTWETLSRHRLRKDAATLRAMRVSGGGGSTDGLLSGASWRPGGGVAIVHVASTHSTEMLTLHAETLRHVMTQCPQAHAVVAGGEAVIGRKFWTQWTGGTASSDSRGSGSTTADATDVAAGVTGGSSTSSRRGHHPSTGLPGGSSLAAFPGELTLPLRHTLDVDALYADV